MSDIIRAAEAQVRGKRGESTVLKAYAVMQGIWVRAVYQEQGVCVNEHERRLLAMGGQSRGVREDATTMYAQPGLGYPGARAEGQGERHGAT
jgi:hypothetical protein